MSCEPTTGDLTTAASWDHAWASPGVDPASWLGRLRAAVHWKFDRMLCRFLDTTGTQAKDILELGCAPGLILERIHQLRPQHRLHGVDFASDGCQLARRHFQDVGVPVQIYEGDIRTIQLRRRYDLVLSCGLIEHFADPTEILRCHVRLAAPGGLVVVTIPNFATPVVQFFLRRFHPEALTTHNLALMRERTLADALRSVGLQDVRVGGAGGAQLVTDVSRPGVAGSIYRNVGRLWNLLVAALPVAPWQAHFWGLGRVEAPSA